MFQFSAQGTSSCQAQKVYLSLLSFDHVDVTWQLKNSVGIFEKTSMMTVTMIVEREPTRQDFKQRDVS